MTEITEANEDERPPGATEETTRALIKIAEATGSDPQKMTDMLSQHIAFFSAALMGHIGKEKAQQFLAIVSANARPMYMVSEEQVDAMKDNGKTVH